MGDKRLNQWIIIPALAALYFGASKLGFTMAFQAAQVTLVWPPTGIALTALLLLGFRVWPGIVLGAFLANVTTHEPVLVAMGIACGNTLEALAGAYLLVRFVRFHNRLDRLKDVLGLIICSAGISTMISASIGVTSLCLGGVQPWTAWQELWLTWWVGDAAGALIVAPVLLVWSSRPTAWRQPARILQCLVLAGGLGITCFGIFTNTPVLGISGHAFVYLIFPFVILAAMCFGQYGTTLVTLAASAIAVRATLLGTGPFTSLPVEQNLASLQVFMATVAVTGLALGAVIAERNRAEKEIRESDRRKEEFLATLAHELRNPLAPMRHALQLIRRPAVETARQRESLDIMERQLRQMVRLVDDLLDASRISHNKIELRKQPITLAEVMDISLETARPLVEAGGHTLSVHLPPEALWLDADPARLAQVFANLLSNAAKYTVQGGHIWLEAEAESDELVIVIRDTGIGIAPEMLTKVFDMFAQADTSVARTRGGLGIGLSLVKTMIERHGGNVTAHSRGVGQGSEFAVRLPLIPPPEVINAPLEDKPAAQPGRRLKILVVDDHQAVAQTLGWMVEALGHEVQLAYDGAQALSLARSYAPDVILMDLGLSGMSGYEVAEQLRREPTLRHCILIAQTGWGQAEHRRRSQAAGFDYHLVKPVEIEMLEHILQSLLPAA